MKTISKVKNKLSKTMTVISTHLFILLASMQFAFAENGTESIDSFQKFICAWLIKIGGMVAMVGGVMFALAWGRQDAEGKSNALLVMMGGFMVVAIGLTPSIFGL